MPELAGLLLAAGGSRRLGRPKQLLRLDGRPLILRQIGILADTCEAVVVVLGGNAERVRPLLAGAGVEIADNPDWATGMASSLRTGLRAVPAAADGVMVLLCDQFRILRNDLLRLRGAWEKEPRRIAAARWDGGRGAPAIFPRSAFERLESLRGERGARALLEQDPAAVSWVELAAAAHDLDTQRDLAGLERD